MDDRWQRARSRAWNGAALAFAGLICALTLGGAGPGGGPTELGVGSPLLSDALRNLALFSPLGAALALAGHAPGRIAGLGLVFSASIELLQLGIDGRISSVVDVGTNTLGTVIGSVLVTGSARWLAPTPAERRMLGPLAAALAWGVLGLTGHLSAPHFSQGTYYGAWRPHLGHMARYPGAVLGARVGSLEIPVGGPAPDPGALRGALEEHSPLEVRWRVVAAPPAEVAPLAIVIGPAMEEAALVATRGLDLVVRYWRRSADLGLEQPELLWPGALAGFGPAELAVLRVEPKGNGARLALEGRGEREIGIGPGRGWALLAPDRWVGPGPRRALDLFWLAALLFPVGLWLPAGRSGTAISAAALLGLALLPAGLGLLVAAPPDWLAALFGLVLGRWIRTLHPAAG